ncbi:MAG: MFS transporter [Alphaproteobacteria bacterium]|nr:MAG: MFS transporter [Alphaproteobacteria bacterium]
MDEQPVQPKSHAWGPAMLWAILNWRPVRFIRTFFKKPLLAAFLLGMTSGFPLTVILGIMTVWLSTYDISKTTIGAFSLATLPYSLKVCWSPLLDRGRLGHFSRAFGQRRAWLVIIMALLGLALWTLAGLRPDRNLAEIGLLCVLIGFLSASFDIVSDAYRIEVTPKVDLAHSAGMYQWGYRLANLIAGAGVFMVAGYYTWGLAISLLPLLLVPGLMAILWIGEPKVVVDDFLAKERTRTAAMEGYKKWLYEAVVLPFKEFLLRRNWFWILAFIVLVKFGDVMASIMTGPFLNELGFSLVEMAFANKTVGAIAAGLGGFAGVAIWWWLDTFKALLVSVLFMMVTNLGFVWLDSVGHDTTALAIAVGLENFATGAGGTVMIAYFGSLCNLSFTATQYSLLTMLSSVARGFFGGFSGMVADATNWTQFFLISTAMALPGLIFLLILWKKDISATGLENVKTGGDI